jgi:hypothetical protein
MDFGFVKGWSKEMLMMFYRVTSIIISRGGGGGERGRLRCTLMVSNVFYRIFGRVEFLKWPSLVEIILSILPVITTFCAFY